MGEGHTHKTLKQTALRWVQSNGCVAFACEVGWGWIGIVDAVGVKANGDVYIVEAKATNSDMRSDTKRGKIYKMQNSSLFDFVYYIVADGVETVHLPDFIGVISRHGYVTKRAVRRERVHNDKAMIAAFRRIAKKCSWRAYGHVIRHEHEQMEFSLMEELS